MGSGDGAPSSAELQTIVISAAIIFIAVVFGTAFICAFVPRETLLEYAMKSRVTRAIVKLVRFIGNLTKRDTRTFGGRQKGKVAPVLNDDEATAAAKKAVRKRKKRIEELALASFTPGMAWCVDRALDSEGSAMYEKGLRLFVEPPPQDGEQADDEAPFVDMGEVVGAEAVEAFPGRVGTFHRVIMQSKHRVDSQCGQLCNLYLTPRE
jgi:hypothetical protein